MIRTDAMKEYSESNTIFGPFVLIFDAFANILIHIYAVTRIQVRYVLAWEVPIILM